MDLAPIFYMLIMLATLALILRVRKLVIYPKNQPRVHRTTYRQVRL